MRIAVAITGASGPILGFRLLEELAKTDHDICYIVTDNARRVIEYEIKNITKPPEQIKYYNEHDVNASINSSSVPLDVTVIVPCSLKTLSAVANGYADNLVVRAAENTLRTGGKLILVPRETPLSASSLENMLKLRRDGAIIFPPAIAFYSHPQTVDEMINFFVGKLLDLMGIPHQLYQRWGDDF